MFSVFMYKSALDKFCIICLQDDEDDDDDDDDKSTTTSEGKRRDKKKESEKKREKVKYYTADPQLLLSFVYFDQSHAGYLLDKDMEEILHTLGLSLSRAQVWWTLFVNPSSDIGWIIWWWRVIESVQY